MKNKTKFNPYWMPNQKSVYDGLKEFAKQIYPSNSRFLTTNDKICMTTNDKICNNLLSAISGLPTTSNKYIIIFQKTVACDILGKHLLGIQTITIEESCKVLQDIRDSYSMSRLLQIEAPKS